MFVGAAALKGEEQMSIEVTADGSLKSYGMEEEPSRMNLASLVDEPGDLQVASEELIRSRGLGQSTLGIFQENKALVRAQKYELLERLQGEVSENSDAVVPGDGL